LSQGTKSNDTKLNSWLPPWKSSAQGSDTTTDDQRAKACNKNCLVL